MNEKLCERLTFNMVEADTAISFAKAINSQVTFPNFSEQLIKWNSAKESIYSVNSALCLQSELCLCRSCFLHCSMLNRDDARNERDNDDSPQVVTPICGQL
jgi:hypothetical protein